MASSVDAKLLKSTKFPPEFNQKVDMTKVNVEVMKKCAESPPDQKDDPRLTVARGTDGLLRRSQPFWAMMMMS